MSKSGDEERLIVQENFDDRRTWGFFEDAKVRGIKLRLGLRFLCMMHRTYNRESEIECEMGGQRG